MSESPPKSANGATPPLDLKAQFAGKKMVIVGGTGFLGKVFWSMMLYEYPEVTRLYVLVRPRKNQTPQQRFADDIIQSEAFEPLRRQHGDNFDTFIADTVVPIGGDVVEPFCGFSSELRDELRGDAAVVINASGVVDFEPPLDIALQVNAFGVKSVVELAKDLGDCPVLHTSTCFVAGARTGQVEELNPSEHPFPRDGELERAHWDADGEISECLDVIEQARHRAGDAFRQSSFLAAAKRNLMARGESTRGSMLESEIAKVRRKFIESELAERGRERAQFWGWPNTYTYTKSIGEQIVVGSGLDYAIARPAIVESSVKYPCKGWNEGINTSAPLIYLIREGQLQIPGSKINLDIIPCDMVAGGMLLTLGELLEGRAKPVYQYGSSDTNPVTVARIVELTGLYKRELWRKTGRGGPAYGAFQTNFETSVLSADQFDIYGPLAISRGASKLSSWVGGLAKGALKPLLKPAADGLKSFAHQQNNIGTILAQYLPFTAKYSYVFQCDNTHAAYARLTDEDREKIIWAPQDLDWRDWMLDVHIPGLEKWVFPNLADKLSKPKPPPKRYETLPAILDEMAERYELSVALQQTEPDGLSRISFRQWHERSLACAKRLQEAGVNEGDRVMLSGANQPSWPIAFFGIMLAGATTVPVDAGIEADVAVNLLKASGAKVFIADGETQARVGDKISELADVKLSDMVEIAQGGAPIAPVDVSSADVAALIYTSGTTGSPKGVMLSHHNLTSLIAALTPLFPLGRGDRVMSVLPLHHTFELTCGLLLPLTRGSRILYIDELTGEKLSHGLKAGRITAMVGVPALWEMLERKLHERIADRGPMAVKVFDIAIDLNRTLSQSTGLDAGKLLFGPVHAGLGGHLKFLVSGGAALSPATHKTFAGMGLHLSEGYGLTEASPVITVSNPKPGERAGHVGKPLAGTELKIHDPDPKGIGEVYARGPTIMLGYADDEEATRDAIDDDGWLHTGDLGKLDRKGNLVLVGRAKDVVVTSAGENIYPDDVEERLGKVAHVAELTLLGMDDANGGERLALVAVPEPDSSRDRAQMRTLAKTSLKEAVNELPAIMRPASTTLVDIPLPRTPTRKVQRRAVKDLLARLEPVDMAASGAVDSDAASKMVRGAAAAIGRKDPESLGPATTLRGDLGFDSLMLLELLVALERRVGCTLDADQLSDCETIGEAEALVRLAGSQAAGSIGAVSIDSGREARWTPWSCPNPCGRPRCSGWAKRKRVSTTACFTPSSSVALISRKIAA